MIRTIIWIKYFLLKLIFTIPALKKAEAMERDGRIKERREFSYRVLNDFCKKLLNLSGSKVTVIGKENIPKNDSVVFVSNHQSYFDILIFIGFVPRPKGFIAKAELKKFPLLRTWMKNINCVLIERGNPRKGLKAINEGIKLLKEGYAMVLFPEGTRSKDGDLLEFKPGSLRLATKSKATVIPVTINGAYKIMPKGKLSIRPADVEVIISEPIKVDEEVLDSNELTNKVRDIISSKLKK